MITGPNLLCWSSDYDQIKRMICSWQNAVVLYKRNRTLQDVWLQKSQLWGANSNAALDFHSLFSNNSSMYVLFLTWLSGRAKKAACKWFKWSYSPLITDDLLHCRWPGHYRELERPENSLKKKKNLNSNINTWVEMKCTGVDFAQLLYWHDSDYVLCFSVSLRAILTSGWWEIVTAL